MKHFFIIPSLLGVWLIPVVSSAADPSLQGLIVGTNDFINSILIPAVLAIAFFIFVVNVVRFFIIGGANEDGQKKAKALALYSVGAFTFILIFWGIVNLLIVSLDLGDDPCHPISDYINSEGTSCPPPANVEIDDEIIEPVTPGGPGITTPSIEPPPTVSPVTPELPVPPTSFTPEGTPIGDPIVATYNDYLEIENSIKTTANNFFNEPAGMAQLFGHNTNAVKSALFADLYMTRVSLVSDAERLTAAYRLERMGAIPTGTTETYLTAFNAYRLAQGNATALTLADISQFSVTPTITITGNRIDTQNGIRAAIIAHNDAYSNEKDVDQTLATLYGDLSVIERQDAIDELYFVTSEKIFNIENPVHAANYNNYIGDINAEIIFQGDFRFID